MADLARRIGADDAAEPASLDRFRRLYGALSDDDRLELFHWLSTKLEVGRGRLDEPLLEVQSASQDDPVEWNDRLRALRKAIASPRQRLFEGLINTSGGMKFVLDLRAEVLDAQRHGASGLDALEEDIAHLLNRWCQHRLLYLEEIDLQSPFQTIRFLKDREMVHPMVGLEEMGRRLGEDRMCFALHHVAMPEEPVVFIEVALSRGLIRSIHDVIDSPEGERSSIKTPDAAIFYSINNTQNGLSGLGLGKVLIFRVTEALRERRPTLKTFATLSPIPGFWPRYLRPILEGRDKKFKLKQADAIAKVPDKSMAAIAARLRELGSPVDGPAEVLLAVLSRPDWISDRVFSRLLRKPLIEIAHIHIAVEKDPRGKPLNPVAGFHLGNGAKVSRASIDFAANRSERGLAESCSLMVNYVYSQRALAPIGRALRSLLPWSGGGRAGHVE